MKHLNLLIMLNLLCLDAYSMNQPGNPPGVQMAPVANHHVQQPNNARAYRCVLYGIAGCFISTLAVCVAIPLIYEKMNAQGAYYQFPCKRITSIRCDNQSISYPEDATPICSYDPNSYMQSHFNTTSISVQSSQEECYNMDSYSCVQRTMLSTPCGNTVCNYTRCDDQGNPCTGTMEYLRTLIQNSFSKFAPSTIGKHKQKSLAILTTREINKAQQKTRLPQQKRYKEKPKKYFRGNSR